MLDLDLRAYLVAIGVDYAAAANATVAGALSSRPPPTPASLLCCTPLCTVHAGWTSRTWRACGPQHRRAAKAIAGCTLFRRGQRQAWREQQQRRGSSRRSSRNGSNGISGIGGCRPGRAQSRR